MQQNEAEEAPVKTDICPCRDHRFVMDWIDVDPDTSQVIWYCECCYAIPSEEQIKNTINTVKK